MTKLIVRDCSILPSPRAWSERLMTRSSVAIAVLAAVAWLSLPAPSAAQIAATVDQSGNMVFVNSNSHPHRSGSTISPPSAAPQAPHDTSAEPVVTAKPRRAVEPPLPPAIPATADEFATA